VMETSTRRQRHWRRAVAMLGACMANTTAGTVYLFSTYGPGMSRQLHLTSTQSNIVAISANYGLLLSGPIFGWAADTLGPRILSAFAAVGSFAAFSALAYTYSGALPLSSWLILSAYMVLIGVSCQAVNMSAITVTTRNFKQNRGSAVSLCLAFFGLSPFVLSHINTIFFASGDKPDIFGYLQFLSFIGLVTSSIASVCLAVVGFGPTRYRRDIPDGFIAENGSEYNSSIVSNEHGDSVSSEERGLLPASGAAAANDNANSSSSSNVRPSYSAVVKAGLNNDGNGTGTTANNSNTPSSSRSVAAATATSAASNANNASNGDAAAIDGIDYDTARNLGGMDYIRDPEAQLLALVLLLCAGIGVFYNNNVGTIVNALYYSSTKDPDPSAAQRLINHHVSAVSLGSFLGRLSIGIISDTCKRLWRLPRSGILVVVAFGSVLSQVVVGTAETLPVLLVGSTLTGSSYGLIFGFVPSLVSIWFGTKHFGSNWGVTAMLIGFCGQGLGA
ncbi:hypothetical protein J3B02_004726, partial [Coemansia erecta]